jgi:hypothetical protein
MAACCLALPLAVNICLSLSSALEGASESPHNLASSSTYAYDVGLQNVGTLQGAATRAAAGGELVVRELTLLKVVSFVPAAPLSAGKAADDIPTVLFSRSRGPGIASNFDNAVANGAPTRLTRVGDAMRKANRRDALRGQSRAPAGQSLDEYPFACSAQRGCGSFVRSVPVSEQNYQGGILSQFFQRSGVQPGDPFNVMFGP